jgi:GAF domain-containing protein
MLRHSRGFEIKGPSEAAEATAAALEAYAGREAISSEEAILKLGVRLAFTVASAVDPSTRATYLRLNRQTLVPVLEIDKRGERRHGTGRSIPLTEHPIVAEAVATGEPRFGALKGLRIGPRVQEFATRTGVVAGIAVPIVKQGSVHGVLAAASRKANFPDEVFESLIVVGRLLELALAAWQPKVAIAS